MKRCIGIVKSDYYRDRHGHRLYHSPMFHYPDFCPRYPFGAVGACQDKCSHLPAHERPCAVSARRARDTRHAAMRL